MVATYGLDSQEYRELKLNPDYIDMELKPEGVMQCEAAQLHANEIDFKYVFVSPMVRTCQTAIHIFKSHPNKKHVRFVVLPSIKEGLNLCNDKQGTPERMRQIIDPLLAENDMKFDFSMMYSFAGVPDLAQVDVSVDLDRMQEMYSYLRSEKHPCFGYSQYLLQIAYDKFPYRMEDPLKMFERGLQLRKFLRIYMQYKGDKGELRSEQKCAIVSHSAFLNSIAAKGYDFEINDLIDPVPMQNCQFIPWTTYDLF